MSDFGWWAEQAKEEAMKVRCKGFGINTPVEWTVVEESSRYYIVKSDSTLGLACLDKAYYEPVQEWVDVTSECHLEWTGGPTFELYHKGNYVNLNNYRIVRNCLNGIKVEVKR